MVSNLSQEVALLTIWAASQNSISAAEALCEYQIFALPQNWKKFIVFFVWNDARVWLAVLGNPLLQIDSSLNSAENKSKFLNSHHSICENKPAPQKPKGVKQRAVFAAGHFPLMCKELISLAAQLPGPREAWRFKP